MKLIKAPPSAAEIFKQITFGTAVGLTNTAKEGQKAVVDALPTKFTLRGSWWQQSNKFGIKITPATKEKLYAEVKTNADWLEIHETGGIKRPRGKNVSVPTFMLRPKGSKKILRADMRPKQLLASGKAFILDTPRGKVIAMQQGKKQKLVILYGLEPTVKIRKASAFHDPIHQVVNRRLTPNIKAGIDRAFATMRR